MNKGKNRAAFLFKSISSYKAPHTLSNSSFFSSFGLFVMMYIIEHGKNINSKKKTKIAKTKDNFSPKVLKIGL